MAERDPVRPLTDAEGEVRELQDEDFARLRRLEDLPEGMQAKLRRVRGPQKAPTKQQVTLRLDREVLERFRSTGSGWQSRINDALRKARVR